MNTSARLRAQRAQSCSHLQHSLLVVRARAGGGTCEAVIIDDVPLPEGTACH